MIPCRLLSVSEFSSLAPHWDALNLKHYGHPLLEWRFVAKTLEHLGSGQERVALCGAAEDPDAIVVLARDRLGAWTTFQAQQAPLGAAILRPGIDPAELTRGLFAQLPLSCQIVAITQQDPDILPRPPAGATLRTLDYIDTARITVNSDFEGYWSSRGKNLRHNMKRQGNRLQREGIEPRLEVFTEAARMRDGVGSYGELESRGWKAGRGTAVHLDNAQGRFYAALLEDYASTGNARIYRYLYGDRLVAVDLCVCNRNALVILKTTYDEAVQASSPALLMRRAYFPPLFDGREVERIEFYGRVMDWHTKWSDEIRTLYHINAYRSAAIARLHRGG